MKPAKNRRIASPAKFVTSAVGTWRIQKSARVMMYGGVRPIAGISVIGARKSGPTPYPRTKSESPRVAVTSPTPKYIAPSMVAGDQMEEPM